MKEVLESLFENHEIEIEDLYNIIKTAKSNLKNREYKEFNNFLNLLLLKQGLNVNEIHQISIFERKCSIINNNFKNKPVKATTKIPKTMSFNEFCECYFRKMEFKSIKTLVKELKIEEKEFCQICNNKNININTKSYLEYNEFVKIKKNIIKLLRQKYAKYRSDHEIEKVISRTKSRKTKLLTGKDKKYIEKRINGKSSSALLVPKGFHM
ncbi:hypothetical protein [Riemerella columbina]|uniref:hypothetical protein n=1 Tax=Riemerella columbina TaxID=103810 RepID=UPI00037811A3|nr:hypothetical protein [Riemerella columbina]